MMGFYWFTRMSAKIVNMRGAAVYPVTFHDGKLLFLLGEEDSYDDSYTEYRKVGAFGGRTNPGESFDDCAAREAFEELNGLYNTLDGWKREFTGHNCVGTVEYEESKAFVVYVPYDPMISRHFAGTRDILHALREHLGISRRDFTKTGYAEKYQIKWYTVAEIEEMRRTSKMRNATKKTFNGMDIGAVEVAVSKLDKLISAK